MTFIKITDAILIGGAHVDVDTVLEIGTDIDAAEAESIVRQGRAVEFEAPAKKPGKEKPAA